MCDCKTEKGVNLDLLNPVLDKYQEQGGLINILQETQDIFGYLPKFAMEYIASKSNNKLATIYGVATFYTQFRLNPIGKHLIMQCQGTACHVNGSKDVSRAIQDELGISPGETTEDMLFTLEDVACLGCCSLAPVIMIDDDTYGNLSPKEAVKIVREYRKRGDQDEN